MPLPGMASISHKEHLEALSGYLQLDLLLSKVKRSESSYLTI